jgi:hypothetical protein
MHTTLSEPQEDLEARLALYSLRMFSRFPWKEIVDLKLIHIASYLHESTLFTSDPKLRQD